MGKKATAFYAERTSEEAGVTVARAPAPEIRIGLSAGLVRMVLLIAIPIVVAVVALLTGTEVGSGKWLTAFFALLLFSALLTLAWIGFRWLRHGHRQKAASAAPAPARGQTAAVSGTRSARCCSKASSSGAPVLAAYSAIVCGHCVTMRPVGEKPAR